MPKFPGPPRITIAAMVAAIGSGLALAFGLFALIGAPYYPLGAAGGPSRELFMASTILLLASGVWGLATARGLLRLQARARISVLVFAALLAFMGAMGTFFLLSATIPAPPGITPEEFRLIRGVASVVYFLFLVIGVWWLVQFNSPDVKDAFRRGGEALPVGPPSEPVRWHVPNATPASPARPRSITIIGWYLLAGGLSSAVQILMGVPATVFGKTLAGPEGSIVYLAMFAIQAYLAVGLFQLQPLSRILAVCFFLLEFVNTALFVALPGRQERLEAMLRASSSATPPQISPPMAYFVLLVSGAIVTALPVWFLITRKNAFPSRPEK